jgi:hypothetical protein
METTTATTNSNMLDRWNSGNRSVLSYFKRMKTCDSATCNPRKDNDAMTSSIARIPPFPSTDASSSDILLSTVSKDTTQTFEDIPSELFIQYILPFVGRHQYRFVATVNHNFHTAYVTAFSKKVTRVNVSTIEHAKICFDEEKGNYRLQHVLCYTAAREGNLSVLKYLRSMQCPWSEWTCAYAAKNGHLDVLQWCRQNGCPWNDQTSLYAAKKGHINVLIWCRQNECPWGERTCEALERKGYCDVLQWSFENGCRCKVCSKYGSLD